MTAESISALDYYDVLEQALSGLTIARGEYRRHFGCSESAPPPGYCWFKGVVSPQRHPDYAEWACNAAGELEDRFLAELPRLRPKSILDVGCGNGALLLRLARSQADAVLAGINFQPAQVRTARTLLVGTAAEVIEADFLEHRFERRFDLVCLLESAFHMPDKAELCQRLAGVVAPGGEVWLLDIVIGERASTTFGNMGRGHTLFNYVPRRAWQRCFSEHGFEEYEFVDLSTPVAKFLQVSDIDVLRREYFLSPLSSTLCEASLAVQRRPEPAIYRELMVQIATQYRRLSRLLQGGMLQYVLMRYRAGRRG